MSDAEAMNSEQRPSLHDPLSFAEPTPEDIEAEMPPNAVKRTNSGPGGTTDTYSVPEQDKWVIGGVEVSKWVWDRHAALQAEVERHRRVIDDLKGIISEQVDEIAAGRALRKELAATIRSIRYDHPLLKAIDAYDQARAT